MSLELKDMVDKIMPIGKSAGDAPDPNLYRPFRQELLESCNGNFEAAERMGDLLVKSGAMQGIFKNVVTTDIGPVRIDSLYPGIALIENRDTPFLNGLESRPVYRSTDYSFRIVEEDAGTQILPFFNLDTDTLPPEYYATLDARYNTIGAVGQTAKITDMTQELAQQGPYNRNENADQIMRAMNRIRRSKNQYLWANTRNTNEVLPSIPQPGGFYTRSTANAAAITGNLTDAIITAMVDQIAAYFGYSQLQGRLVLQVPRSQLPVIRNLLITRFPGTTALTNLEFTNLLKGQASDYNFRGYPVNMVYQDNNGMVIPIFVDDQAPSGVAIMWLADLPQLAGFQFRGSMGPHIFQLPIALLSSYALVMDIFSIADPLVVSRSSRSGVGS